MVWLTPRGDERIDATGLELLNVLEGGIALVQRSRFWGILMKRLRECILSIVVSLFLVDRPVPARPRTCATGFIYPLHRRLEKNYPCWCICTVLAIPVPISTAC